MKTKKKGKTKMLATAAAPPTKLVSSSRSRWRRLPKCSARVVGLGDEEGVGGRTPIAGTRSHRLLCFFFVGRDFLLFCFKGKRVHVRVPVRRDVWRKVTDFKVSYTRRVAWVMETLELKFVGFLSGLLFGLIRGEILDNRKTRSSCHRY